MRLHSGFLKALLLDRVPPQLRGRQRDEKMDSVGATQGWGLEYQLTWLLRPAL